MTHKEKCKIAGLVGMLRARRICLANDITSAKELQEKLVSDRMQGYNRGRLEEMERWQKWNASLLAEVEQLLEGGKDG